MFLKALNKIGFALVAVFLILTTWAYAQDDEIYGRRKSLKLEVKSEKMINVVDKPVVIEIVLRNMIDESLEIVEPAIDTNSFLIEITMPNGKKDKLLDIYGLKLKTIRLYPKKRLKFKTKFIPEITGPYDIEVRYNGFVEEKLEAEIVTVFVVNSSGE
ncbi:MAG: hypothetical protein KAS13_00580 [Candidatus Omnitrophica bacterium]|nr:hypothetical protein [Candidatus Omnitrophota bacterium]